MIRRFYVKFDGFEYLCKATDYRWALTTDITQACVFMDEIEAIKAADRFKTKGKVFELLGDGVQKEMK